MYKKDFLFISLLLLYLSVTGCSFDFFKKNDLSKTVGNGNYLTGEYLDADIDVFTGESSFDGLDDNFTNMLESRKQNSTGEDSNLIQDDVDIINYVIDELKSNNN